VNVRAALVASDPRKGGLRQDGRMVASA